MLYQIVSFLLDVAVSLLGGACLMRAYMQAQRVSFVNPVGRLVFALSDWLVLPLRRMLPPVAKWDTASVAGAALLELAQYLLLWLLVGAREVVAMVPVLALFGLVRLALTGLTGMLIVYAILSWVQTHSPVQDVLQRLCEPVLRPVRPVVPLVGGVDLSPLVALVALNVATMVLGHVQAAVLGLL